MMICIPMYRSSARDMMHIITPSIMVNRVGQVFTAPYAKPAARKKASSATMVVAISIR